MQGLKRGMRAGLLLSTAIVAGACASAPGAAPPPTVGGTDAPPPVEREFRGAWIASVANLDWPSQPGLPPDSQRAELRRQLDRAAELKLNAVIFQVRPAADALYASSLEPWSEWLTGEQGRAPDPFYDPLEFAVAEAHARGLELHAWFNPYRAVHPAARGPMAPSHISRANPELVVQYGTYGWMDPGADAVRQRSLDVIVDVVRRYDIDGVHIDDYFYPYRVADAAGREIDFPDSLSYARYRGTGGTLDRSHWRRWNVDRFVAEMYAAVKREKPWVKVGISPIGSWRPNVMPQLGGFDAYESIYADARKWIMDGDLDYLVPQLYWPIARVDVSFPVLLDWWARQNPHGRALYAGLIPDRVNHGQAPASGWLPDEILGQIYIARAVTGSHGHVHFRMRSLMPGGAMAPVADTVAPARADSIRAAQVRLQGRRDSLTARLAAEAYARPALVPAMPWLDDVPPPAPAVIFTDARRRSIAIRPQAAARPRSCGWCSGRKATPGAPTCCLPPRRRGRCRPLRERAPWSGSLRWIAWATAARRCRQRRRRLPRAAAHCRCLTGWCPAPSGVSGPRWGTPPTVSDATSRAAASCSSGTCASKSWLRTSQRRTAPGRWMWCSCAWLTPVVPSS
jgi:uncharacterized lipoprotein YddW (UPF0748 family)